MSSVMLQHLQHLPHSQTSLYDPTSTTLPPMTLLRLTRMNAHCIESTPILYEPMLDRSLTDEFVWPTGTIVITPFTKK